MSTLDIAALAPADRRVDARGLDGPLPILRARKALNDRAGGQTMRVPSIDPSSVRDFHAYSHQTRDEPVGHGGSDRAFWLVLKRR